jgi:uncharacterized protein YrrD
MLKASDLVGKPITAYNTGQIIDSVDTLVSDPFHYQIVAFVVWSKGETARALPWSGVHRVEPQRVIARSPQMIVEVSQLFEIRQLLERPTVKAGTRIMTTNGHDLGLVKDIYFDTRTGSIEGYDVMGGVFGDPETGRAFVPASHMVRITAHTAFVVPRTLRLMEEGSGPPETKAKSREAKEAIQSALLQIRHAESGISTTDIERPSTPVIKPVALVERARGRRVRWDLRTEGGKLIAAARQIVTTKVIDRARAVGKERDLLESVGLEAKPNPTVPSLESEREQMITYESIIHAKHAGMLESMLSAAYVNEEPIEIPCTLDRRRW